MALVDYIVQPDVKSTSSAISQVLDRFAVSQMDVAVAYMTTSGVKVLFSVLDRHSVARDRRVVKRWITSFDYCRTDPLALEAILSLPSSSVRIFGADACLANGGIPVVPFHPKTFLFHGARERCVLAGSGNVSRSGLSQGIEIGLLVSVGTASGARERSAATSIEAIEHTFEQRWKDATPLRTNLLTQYKQLYERADRIRNAVPTEDDVASSDKSRGSMSSDMLKKLRVCRNLWIEAGKVTMNRGPGVPGNQLMMKRLSRVFFDFESTSVPENTSIGHVNISFNGGAVESYSLTYSDNGMDKLVLPIPGVSGPSSYDGETLLFSQVSFDRFRLSIGAAADKASWFRRSRAIDGAFSMSSGRQWGVF